MNDLPSAPLIAAEEVRSNFIKSFVLVGIIIALVIAASYFIGYMLGDIKTGLLIGGGISVIVIPLQIMTAKWMILGMSLLIFFVMLCVYMFGMRQKETYTYEQTGEAFKNPMMGFAPSANYEKAVGNNTLVYVG